MYIYLWISFLGSQPSVPGLRSQICFGPLSSVPDGYLREIPLEVKVGSTGFWLKVQPPGLMRP